MNAISHGYEAISLSFRPRAVHTKELSAAIAFSSSFSFCRSLDSVGYIASQTVHKKLI